MSNACNSAKAATRMSAKEKEFERVVMMYQRRLYNVALRLAQDPEEASELVQDTFLRAYRAWDKFRKESQTYTWLYRILINLNKDRLAKVSKRRELETSLDESEEKSAFDVPADHRDRPDFAAETSELRQLLIEAIDSLPAGYKECVVLKDMEGLSYEEIAETMEITVEAVRSRLARARQQLRSRLSPYLKIQ